MTDKERLEGIKQNGFGAMEYLHLDIKWLIEQAERFERLSEEYVKTHMEKCNALSSLHNTNEIALETDQDNKRLRKALKFYADENNNLLVDGENTTVSIDSGKIARQALSE